MSGRRGVSPPPATLPLIFSPCHNNRKINSMCERGKEERGRETEKEKERDRERERERETERQRRENKKKVL